MTFLRGDANGLHLGAGGAATAAYLGSVKVWPTVTQPLIDAYIAAVNAQRRAQVVIDHYGNAPWHSVHDKFRDAMRHLEYHSSWGYPWDTFFNEWDTNQIKDYFYSAGSHSPGLFGETLGFFTDPRTRVVDIVALFILFGINNVNPAPDVKTKWEERRIAYYIIANQQNSPPPTPAHAVAQWELLRAHVNDLSHIPPGFQGAAADLIEAAQLVWCLTHKSALDQDVANAAKAITDLGGTLPVVP